MDWSQIFSLESPEFYLSLVLRLVIACVLGGIIGYERESTHRPAGFRTHILVCVGSALVMVTSEFIFKQYRGLANVDPARLGAQVISGIGFLGAGTIIREGFNVSGLTTAASLWAVSCVGIAVGIGFYGGAVVATMLIFMTLILLKKLERTFKKKNHYRTVYVQASNGHNQLGAIADLLGSRGIVIRNIEFSSVDKDNCTVIKLLVRQREAGIKVDIIQGLYGLEGVQKVYEE